MKRLYLIQERIALDALSANDRAEIQYNGVKWPLQYVVVKVVDAIDPRIGDKLTPVQVDAFCLLPDWHVEITA